MLYKNTRKIGLGNWNCESRVYLPSNCKVLKEQKINSVAILVSEHSQKENHLHITAMGSRWTMTLGNDLEMDEEEKKEEGEMEEKLEGDEEEGAGGGRADWEGETGKENEEDKTKKWEWMKNDEKK